MGFVNLFIYINIYIKKNICQRVIMVINFLMMLKLRRWNATEFAILFYFLKTEPPKSKLQCSSVTIFANEKPIVEKKL